MTSGRVLINGVEILKITELPNEIKQFEKSVKQALIGFGTMYNFDYEKDSVSLQYDLGEGFIAIFTKTKDAVT